MSDVTRRASLLAGLLLSSVITSGRVVAGADGPQADVPRGRAFWDTLKSRKFDLPSDVSAKAVLDDVDALLASPDPVLRDALGYETAAALIYRERRLSHDELWATTERWMGNLRKGAGERGTDGVLLRSFSALCLSIVAAADNRASTLSPAEHGALTDAALQYLQAEKDLRGYDDDRGWLHATAHTADLLKFLARSPHFGPARHRALLDAITARLTSAGEIFTHGEQARLAAAVASLVARTDLDTAVLDAWLEARAVQATAMWKTMPRIDHATFVVVQNHKQLLEALVVALAGEPATPEKEAARRRVVATLAKM
ncbi:MAG: DUF2785 domain-containing protein [Vicinamibacterales bacterium]